MPSRDVSECERGEGSCVRNGEGVSKGKEGPDGEVGLMEGTELSSIMPHSVALE